MCKHQTSATCTVWEPTDSSTLSGRFRAAASVYASGHYESALDLFRSAGDVNPPNSLTPAIALMMRQCEMMIAAAAGSKTAPPPVWPPALSSLAEHVAEFEKARLRAISPVISIVPARKYDPTERLAQVSPIRSASA